MDADKFKRLVGLNIEMKRKEKNLTQEKLAEKLGVTKRTVYNYEKGKNLDLILFYHLSEIFNCNIEEFFLGFKTTHRGE